MVVRDKYVLYEGASHSNNGVLSCPIMLFAFTKSKSLQIHQTIS
jgi:hypothetical protein